MKHKVKIRFEIEEVTFFKTRKILFAFCGHCNSRVEVLTAENAALLLGWSEIQIICLINAGKIHFIEANKVYICRNSLEIWADVYWRKHFAQTEDIKKLMD